jgi:hypothetical protein
MRVELTNQSNKAVLSWQLSLIPLCLFISFSLYLKLKLELLLVWAGFFLFFYFFLEVDKSLHIEWKGVLDFNW